jgi:hypothetical protein
MKLEPVATLRDAIGLVLVDDVIRNSMPPVEDEEAEEPFES